MERLLDTEVCVCGHLYDEHDTSVMSLPCLVDFDGPCDCIAYEWNGEDE